MKAFALSVWSAPEASFAVESAAMVRPPFTRKRRRERDMLNLNWFRRSRRVNPFSEHERRGQQQKDREARQADERRGEHRVQGDEAEHAAFDGRLHFLRARFLYGPRERQAHEKAEDHEEVREEHGAIVWRHEGAKHESE